MYYYVYIYTDPRNNQPFYIGKGKGDRYKSHLTETYKNTENRKKFYKIKSIRKSGLEPEINFYGYYETEKEAYDVEDSLIKKYGRKHIDSNGILTNICIDNRPPNKKGIPQSKEHKKKRSESLKGIPKSPEHKKKISKSKKGQISWNKGLTSPKKGKTYEELYGPKEAKIIKEKIRKSIKGYI